MDMIDWTLGFMRPCHIRPDDRTKDSLYINGLHFDFSMKTICYVSVHGVKIDQFTFGEILKEEEIPFRISRRILESRITRRWIDKVCSFDYWKELSFAEVEELLPYHLKRAELELECEHITPADCKELKMIIKRMAAGKK